MEAGFGTTEVVVAVVAQEEAEADLNLVEDPWMNDLILDKVFKRCTPGALSACRLVCKNWYSESLRVWNSGRGNPIKILCKRKRKQGVDDDWRLDDAEQPGLLYMSDFVQDFHSTSSSRPESADINGMAQYKSFYLKFDRGLEEVPLLDGFWNRNGNWITSLKISYNGALLDADFVRHIFWCDYTPQLQELEMDIYYLKRSKSVSLVAEQAEKGKRIGLRSLKLGGDCTTYFNLLVDWKAYLGSCPVLENLDIMGTRNPKSHLEILTAIKDIRAEEDKSKLCLKSLSLAVESWIPAKFASTSLLKLLKESQLDLESLSVDYDSDVPYSQILEMNTMYSKTLKKLNFHHLAQLPASPFSGTQMTHLDSLVVQGRPVDNLLFLQELPVLRSLKLMLAPVHKLGVNNGRFIPPRRIPMISATKDEDMRGVSLHSLSSFCSDYIGDFEPEDLSRLRGWMPALLRLELQLDSDNFPTVCQLWPGLRHVCIFGGRIGDRGLVGLDTTRNGQQISFNEPNITNLEDLRSFVVRTSYGRRRHQEGDLRLSCHSVKQGLSKLRRLEEVTISKTAAPDNHEEIEACMRKELPFATIKIADDERSWIP